MMKETERYSKFQNIAWVTRIGEGEEPFTAITVNENGDFTIMSLFEDEKRGGCLSDIPRSEMRLLARRIILALEQTKKKGGDKIGKKYKRLHHGRHSEKN